MLLADIILIIHFIFVLFVVGSLPIIWMGAWMRLDCVRNRRFRLAHIFAILFVVVESSHRHGMSADAAGRLFARYDNG